MSNEPQRLPALELITCEKCGQRVNFRFHASRPLDSQWRVVYLRCPACGASATQMQEREQVAVKHKKVRFNYLPGR